MASISLPAATRLHSCPNLRQAGQTARMGRGRGLNIHPQAAGKILVVLSSGAMLVDWAGQVLWEIDESPVHSGAVSRERLALGGEGSVHLWDLSLCQEQAQFQLQGVPAPWVHALAFSADGTRLAVGVSGSVSILDLQGGTLAQASLDHRAPKALTFHPDGRLAVAAGTHVYLWKMGEDPAVVDIFFEEVNALAWTHDGSRLAAGSREGEIRVWDAVADRTTSLEGHPRSVTGLTFHPATSELVSVGEDGTLRGWDIGSGGRTFVVVEDDRLSAASFSPDGADLVSADLDGLTRSTLTRWSGRPERPKIRLSWPSDLQPGVHLSSDGTTVAWRETEDQVSLWSIPMGQQSSTVVLEDSLDAMALSPDGTTLAWHGRKRGLGLVNLADGSRRALGAPAGEIRGLEFSPEGDRVAALSFDADLVLRIDGQTWTGGEVVEIWDLSTGQSTHRLDAVFDPQGQPDHFVALSFAPGGRLLALACDHDVLIVDLESSHVVRRLEGLHDYQGTEIAFSRDGRWLVACGRGEFGWCFWSLRRWRVLRNQPDSPVVSRCLALSGNGIMAAGGEGIGLYRLGRRGTLARIPSFANVTAAALSADGDVLLSGHEDGTVRVWAVGPFGRPARFPDFIPKVGLLSRLVAGVRRLRKRVLQALPEAPGPVESPPDPELLQGLERSFDRFRDVLTLIVLFPNSLTPELFELGRLSAPEGYDALLDSLQEQGFGRRNPPYTDFRARSRLDEALVHFLERRGELDYLKQKMCVWGTILVEAQDRGDEQAAAVSRWAALYRRADSPDRCAALLREWGAKDHHVGWMHAATLISSIVGEPMAEATAWARDVCYRSGPDAFTGRDPQGPDGILVELLQFPGVTRSILMTVCGHVMASAGEDSERWSSELVGILWRFPMATGRVYPLAPFNRQELVIRVNDLRYLVVAVDDSVDPAGLETALEETARSLGPLC